MFPSPQIRKLSPVLLLLAMACKGDGGNNGGPPPARPTLDIPESWKSKEASIVMRITDANTTSTQVKRALNNLANGDPAIPSEEPVDPLYLMMRMPETDESGTILEPDPTLSTAEKLAGSSVEQAVAFRERMLDGGESPFPREEAVDACGNEMIMSVLSPNAIQAAIPQGAQDQNFWSSSCPDGLDCNTIEPGTWDIALGELRYDGMIDMVVNLNPDVRIDPIRPGAFGHLTALFLSENNPGTLAAPMIANFRRVQINMIGVWELHQAYRDGIGYRELYKFPHRSRQLNSNDVFVYLEGDKTGEDYWSYLFPNDSVPLGLADAQPLALDITAPLGEQLAQNLGEANEFNTLIHDALVHQIGATISCPSVREISWVRKGPVEFFLCPDVDLDTCVATEDLEEGACAFLEEPEPSVFDPAPVSFQRTLVETAGSQVVMLENQLPQYLSTISQIGTVRVQIDVEEDTVLHMRDASRIVSAETLTGVDAPLPSTTANTHCPSAQVQRLALGEEWAPGNYVLTLDLSPGTDWDFDDATGDALLWFYYSSVDAWKQRQ